MGLIKKNIVFSLSLCGFILVAACGVYLMLQQYAQVSLGHAAIARNEMKLQRVRLANPSPSIQNVDASEGNVVELRQQLAELRADLQRGPHMQASLDGVRVMAGIQQFISDFSRSAETHLDGSGEAAPIRVDEGMAFGFEAYAQQASVPEAVSAIPKLDQQRQVLVYILTQLIDANPQAILSVERELVVGENLAAEQVKSSFRIEPAVSARVADAIDTLAFRVVFDGYTDNLRLFLNNLAQFDWPIVVRSVQVERPDEQVLKSESKPPKSTLDELFGAFASTAASSEIAEVVESQKPVVSENASRFMVTLEFIEIISSVESTVKPV